MKKITQKEFWEILEKAGMSKDVWGYEGILNIISIKLANDSEEMKRMGLNNGAKRLRNESDYIFNLLLESGYFNEEE